MVVLPMPDIVETSRHIKQISRSDSRGIAVGVVRSVGGDVNPRRTQNGRRARTQRDLDLYQRGIPMLELVACGSLRLPKSICNGAGETASVSPNGISGAPTDSNVRAREDQSALPF
jgi:hypothetical protein